MSKAKLVVAIPVYNGARTLLKTLQNIADQDFRNFRVLIVENRSTDDTIEIAKSFCVSDQRFEVLANEDHLSALDNFTRAVGLASERGEYFCLRACDDLSSLNYLSTLVQALDANPKKLLAVSTVKRIKGDDVNFVTPSRSVFDFPNRAISGDLPNGMPFPAEWFYGMYRSEGGAEILLRRWPELDSAWCAASYALAEFIMRDLFVYSDQASFDFYVGSGSRAIYSAKTLPEKVSQRWRYAIGCYRVVHKLPPLPLATRFKILRVCWAVAGNKLGYRFNFPWTGSGRKTTSSAV